MKKTISALSILFALVCTVFASDNRETVAVFVRNASGDAALDKYTEPLGAAVSAKLNAAGFSAMDKNIIITELSKLSGDDAKKYAQALKSVSTDKSDAGASQIYDNASMLRVAQMLGANYFADAAILSMASEKRSYTADGVSTLTLRRVLRAACNMYEAGVGKGAAGGTFAGEISVRQSVNLQIDDADTINALVDSLAGSAAITLAEALQKKSLTPKESSSNKVEFCCFIDGMSFPLIERDSNGEYIVTSSRIPASAGAVSVILDGVLSGNAATTSSNGTIVEIPSGIHQLRFERAYLQPFERMVNISGNTKIFTVYMQMTDAARERWKADAKFFDSLKVGEKLTDAQVKVLDGLSKAYGNSGFKVDYKTDTKEPITIQQNSSILPQPAIIK